MDNSNNIILDNSNNVILDNSNNVILEVTENTTTSNDEHNNTSININDKSYEQCSEFIIFKNELESLITNNLYILKECKSNKRLLDIRSAELTKAVNYIQISVIFLSTLSGFLQSTKNYFFIPDNTVAVCGITISTYISLILSISKYYKFDENKEIIYNLREKYGKLHNKIEFRMDILGPHNNYKLWEHQNPQKKLEEWNKIKIDMEEEYVTLIQTKQTLTTEFKSIMDSKSRNKNYIKDRELVLYNREKLYNSLKKHNKLENRIKNQNISTDFKSAIELPDDDLNNWDDPL